MAYPGNKKPKVKALFYPYTNADMKRVQWCLDRKIKIAVIPNGTNWQVEITIDKSVNLAVSYTHLTLPTKRIV